MPIVDYIKGDIRDTEIDTIAHGVNCRNAMGSGVAKALFDKWYDVKTEYHRFCKVYFDKDVSSTELLGRNNFVIVAPDKIVINMFTQDDFGYDGVRHVNYEAIARCFERVDSYGVKELAIPKIGCGLAGGDWNVVSEIINSVAKNTQVTVYCL